MSTAVLGGPVAPPAAVTHIRPPKLLAPSPAAHLGASTVAAMINFPLFKSSAMAQTGYPLRSKTLFGKMIESMQPPWRGALTVIAGMSWARAAIFYGSEIGRSYLKKQGAPPAVATAAPALVISTMVQVINMPLVRSSIMLQDPACKHRTAFGVAGELVRTRGWGALWHGLSAGIGKAVPKYVTAVAVKQWMEGWLTPVEDPAHNRTAWIIRSAKKAVTAGVLGAVLTNPFDVLRNHMFRTHMGMVAAVKDLHATSGWKWLARGMANNVIAVAIPIATTIWLADVFSRVG